MQGVILAGGLATRLRPMSKNIPKSMVIINGKPFLEYQIEWMKNNNITDIVICVGHLSEQIEKYFGHGKKFEVSIAYSKEEKLLGTAGALKNAEGLLDDVFLETNGDSILPIDLIDPFSRFFINEKLGMTIVYKNFNQHEKSNVTILDGFVVQYDKKQGDFEYIDAGISIFRKKALEIIPENSVCDLTYLLKELIRRKELIAYETKQKVYEIGSPEGLKEFTSSINEITRLMVRPS